MMSNLNVWGNFLENEKLESKRMDDPDTWVPRLLDLMKVLAEQGRPDIRMHKNKLQTRRKVCETAIELGIDLPAIKYRGKAALGRGLLDMWNIVYRDKFGSTYGTAASMEAQRRDIKTRLCNQGIQAPKRDFK